MYWVSAKIVEFHEYNGIQEFHAPPAPLAPPWGAGRDPGPAPDREGHPWGPEPPPGGEMCWVSAEFVEFHGNDGNHSNRVPRT